MVTTDKAVAGGAVTAADMAVVPATVDFFPAACVASSFFSSSISSWSTEDTGWRQYVTLLYSFDMPLLAKLIGGKKWSAMSLILLYL